MKLRMLVIALIAALGSGCASTDGSRLAYQVKPFSAVSHGAPNAQSYYQLARYYQGQKRLDMAEAAYRKSIALDDRQVAAYNALASLYAERGELDRAIQLFAKALAMAPDAGYLYNNLGFAYYLQGRLDEAYDAVRKALIRDATLLRGWANLERIASAHPDSALVAAARSRRVEALPATLLADSTPGQTAIEPAAEAIASSSDSNRAVLVEPTSDLGQSGITVVDVRDASLLAQGSAITVSNVASPPVTVSALQPIENAEERIESGAFVLVSTGRDVVDPVKPLSISKAEPAGPTPGPVGGSIPDTEFDVDLSTVNIEVSNANGVGGFARKFREELRQNHIPVRRTTNYVSFLLKETVIEYQPGYQNAARALMLRTQLDVRLTPAKGPRVNSDVRILLGRNALALAKTVLAKSH